MNVTQDCACDALQELQLSIGCVPLRLTISESDLHRVASGRYGAFRDAEVEAFSISVERRKRRRKSKAEFQYDLEGAVLESSGTKSSFQGVGHEYALDSLLRIQLSWMLLVRWGFLLHAATVTRNGWAYIFTGRSGAGKSTVASLAPEGSVLTDEISLVRREEGEWRAYGTPFWGEFRAAGRNVSAPVKGIFRLIQATENRVEAMESREFLKTLMPNILFFSREREANARLLEIAERASNEVAGYALAFRKDASFWKALP